MKLTLLLYALAMVRYSAHAVGSARRMPRVVQSSRRHQQQSRPSTQNCTWKYYTQPLSHFSEGSTVNGNASFSQRVCIIDRYWKAPSVAMLGAGAGGVQGAGQQLKGPILFYTGNESPIDEYVNNTGLMWSLAPKLGALLVFAEHRYEGESYPDVVGMPNCLSHCTSAEALADYASVVTMVKDDLNATTSPTIAFGGSYGGMLSAWLRMKYPNIVDGAIAASAPIWSFPASHPPLDGFGRTITRGVSAAGGATDTCRDNLIAAFPLINEAGKSSAGRAVLSSAFQTCTPLQSMSDIDALLHTAQKPWLYLAEGNYPFPSTYIPFSLDKGETPLPAWPMRVACDGGLNTDLGITLTGNHSDLRYSISLGSNSSTTTVDWDVTATADGHPLISDANSTEAQTLWRLVRGVSEAILVWNNISGNIHCIDVHIRDDDGDRAAVAVAPPAPSPPADTTPPPPVQLPVCTARDKQPSWEPIICNEHWNQVVYKLQGIGNDFFWPPNAPRNWTYADQVTHAYNGCRHWDDGAVRGYPLSNDPLSHWVDEYYGGKTSTRTASNIVFSNGQLDPWSSGGVLTNESLPSSVIALLLPMGAHHLDLMFEDPADPPDVKQARAVEEAHINTWIVDAYRRNL
jgi:lysosomal Pro-X carboxypeptidase